jgi:hypothetical protein
MEIRVLTQQEVRLTKLNAYLFEAIFKYHKSHCANAECGYPVDIMDSFYSHEAAGKICDLCHTLEDAARQQPGLRAAQEEWKQSQAAKRKILDRNNYL